ncbi:MAG: hypothetical protein AB1563_11325 [Bacillota bacterium]
MGRYRRSYGQKYRDRSYGRERALEHIRQAEQLSRELGGTDKDVKAYFFSLRASALSQILAEYERLHGHKAREYAEKTIPSWRSGRVHMSGMVAERLFSLLPKHMPLEQKYKLTESLWRHVGPVSRRTLYVNPNVEPAEVIAVVKEHLERDVLSYAIPEPMEQRFTWLSQGDIDIKQKLLNFLRAKDRELAAESLRTNLPILTEHLRSAQGSHTHHLTHKLQVGKNEIAVALTSKVEGITEIAPHVAASTSSAWGNSWIWWLVGIVVLIALSQA